MRLVSLMLIAVLACCQFCDAGQVTRSRSVTVNVAPAPTVETIIPAVNDAPMSDAPEAVQSAQQTQVVATHHRRVRVRPRRAATLYAVTPAASVMTYSVAPTMTYVQAAPVQRSYSSTITRTRSSGGCQCGCGDPNCRCGR